MRSVLTGKIDGREAWIGAHVRKGTLVLAPPTRLRLVIDTGFTGTIALPAAPLRGLVLEPLGTEWYSLADGQRVDSVVYLGRVVVDGRSHDVDIVTFGDEALIGMEFLERMGDELRLVFRKGRVELLASP